MLAARGHVGCIDRNGPVLLTDVIAAGGARSAAKLAVSSASRPRITPARAANRRPWCCMPCRHFAIAGAASAPPLDEIVEVSHRAGLPVIDFCPPRCWSR